MLILANENIPKSVVDLLASNGHDVNWIRSECPGISDAQVLTMAIDSNRLLITFDKDYGELVFRSGWKPQCGIVIFRMKIKSPSLVAEKIATVLESRTDWQGMLSVVEEDRIRMNPIRLD